MAKISDFVTYPNAVPASLPLIERGGEGRSRACSRRRGLTQKLFTVTPYDQKIQRTVTRLWTKLVTGS